MKIILTESQFRKIVHLDESIKQGEDWYRKQYGEEIPNDNPDYNELKDLLIKNNNTGYMPWLIKLSVYDNFYIGLDVYKNIILPNKDVIKRLPKQVVQYNDAHELFRDIVNLRKDSSIKKIMNLIPKKDMDLYNQFEKDLKYNVSEIELDYFVNKIYPTKFLKVFTNKISRYSNSKELVRYFKGVITDHERGFIYELMLPKLESLGNDIVILATKNNEKESYIFVWTKTYEALKEVGSSAWCIVGSEDTFNQYTENAEQFVLVDFHNDDINYGVIGFTINDNYNITYAHLRDDKNFINEAAKYLDDRGFTKLIKMGSNYTKKIKFIDKKISQYNKFFDNINNEYDPYEKQNEILVQICNKIFQTNYYPEYTTVSFKYFVFSLLKNFLNTAAEKNFVEKKLKEILSLAIKKVNVIKYLNFDKKLYTNRVDEMNFMNEFFGLVFNPEMGLSSKYKINENELKRLQSVVIDMYKNGYNFDYDIIDIIQRNMFEKYGREKTLLFIKMRQDKRGEENTPVVFHGTKDRTNYKTMILDKIQMSRRENYNELTFPEVKYAMENGMEKSIRDLYGRLLNTYVERQLDYEDMNIYKHIGMYNELEKVIMKKGDAWGKDSLNSIEYSIYELSKKNKD